MLGGKFILLVVLRSHASNILKKKKKEKGETFRAALQSASSYFKGKGSLCESRFMSTDADPTES